MNVKNPINPAAPKLPKHFFRRREAAFSLGVSVREIDRLIAEDALTTRRYKRCVLIPAADVERVAREIEARKR